jgi:hypothetical protein
MFCCKQVFWFLIPIDGFGSGGSSISRPSTYGRLKEELGWPDARVADTDLDTIGPVDQIPVIRK